MLMMVTRMTLMLMMLTRMVLMLINEDDVVADHAKKENANC